MTVAHESLDRLVEGGVITGYTCEDSVAYLSARRPTLTYSMYVDDAASLANRDSFAREMIALGGRPRETAQVGQLGTGQGVERSRQVRVVVEFDAESELSAALDVVIDRFTKGGAGEVPGSWTYPDVRITGTLRRREGTMTALAHVSKDGPQAFVVLSTDPRSPLPGMARTTLQVLECWRAFPGFVPSEMQP